MKLPFLVYSDYLMAEIGHFRVWFNENANKHITI